MTKDYIAHCHADKMINYTMQFQIFIVDCLSTAHFQMEVCTLMCDKLKLSTWKVQLAVLQSMKAYFQG